MTLRDLPMGLMRRLKGPILGVAGFLVPLFTFVPNTWMWWGLMSMPLIAYFSSTAYIPHLWDEIAHVLFDFSFLSGWHGMGELLGALLIGGIVLLARAMIVGGFALLVYSLLHLLLNGNGLVTDGPYGRVRHPQYLGIILMTAGITFFVLPSNPVWVWGEKAVSLPKVAVLCVWLLQVTAYVLLARIEERHLTNGFGERYRAYARSVPFMVPHHLLKR